MDWINKKRSIMVPGTRKLRDKSRLRAVRTVEHWQLALEGHIKVSHGGTFDPNCPGCRELKEEARGRKTVGR